MSLRARTPKVNQRLSLEMPIRGLSWTGVRFSAPPPHVVRCVPVVRASGRYSVGRPFFICGESGVRFVMFGGVRFVVDTFQQTCASVGRDREMEVQGRRANAGKVALVLEGGSYRCQFTAGVLDVLLEHNVGFDACFGVSAGALGGMNYKSRQIGRCNRVNLAYCNDSRYMGGKALAQTGSIVGYDFMLNDVQDRIDPFDNEAFDQNPMKLYAVATDIVFGTAAYLPVENAVLDIDAVRASTSLPLVTTPVEIDGNLYLDGGVADSVPVEHVLEDEGYGRAVVVLSQDRSYVKGSYDLMGPARARYGAYPYLLEALENRHERYNEQRAHIWAYEEEGRALVVAPPTPVTVGHIEHDATKLLDLYIQGRQEGARLLDDIERFVR